MTNSSAHKKGPPGFGGPSLGRNTPRSKNSSRAIAISIWRVIVFRPSSFKQENGCWIVFFGTEAVK
jgi:hypothetical protein